MKDHEEHHDDDARLDALLAAADAAVLRELDIAFDTDAGSALIFASSMVPETVPDTTGTLDAQLESILSFSAEDVAQWLAISGPGFLPQQLDKATSSIKTMTVVGRALLPPSMAVTWALATDFLTQCRDHIIRLKTGLAHRELPRTQALALLHDARTDIERFTGTLSHAAQTSHGHQADSVKERLIAKARMIQTLLEWVRNSIEALFKDTDHSLRAPVR